MIANIAILSWRTHAAMSSPAALASCKRVQFVTIVQRCNCRAHRVTVGATVYGGLVPRAAPAGFGAAAGMVRLSVYLTSILRSRLCAAGVVYLAILGVQFLVDGLAHRHKYF